LIEHTRDIAGGPTDQVSELLEAGVHAGLRANHQLLEVPRVDQECLWGEFDPANRAAQRVTGVAAADERMDDSEMFDKRCETEVPFVPLFARCAM
jgi:hypothetical protein